MIGSTFSCFLKATWSKCSQHLSTFTWKKGSDTSFTLRYEQAIVAQNTASSWGHLHFIRAQIFTLKRIFEHKISVFCQWLEKKCLHSLLASHKAFPDPEIIHCGQLSYIPAQNLKGSISKHHSVMASRSANSPLFLLKDFSVFSIFYQWQNVLPFQHSDVYYFPSKLSSVILEIKEIFGLAHCENIPSDFWCFDSPKNIETFCIKVTILWTAINPKTNSSVWKEDITLNWEWALAPTPDPSPATSRSCEHFLGPAGSSGLWTCCSLGNVCTDFCSCSEICRISQESKRMLELGRTCLFLLPPDWSWKACLFLWRPSGGLDKWRWCMRLEGIPLSC